MTSKALLFLMLAFTGFASGSYRQALPGYTFQFPRDHFDHPEFRTEWWYYTGNLQSDDGKRFGFELTFFRHAVEPQLREDANIWDVRDVWMAHFALSDLDGQRFFNTERLNRSGARLAGVDAESGRIWNGNWSVRWTTGTQKLKAVSEDFSVDLSLRSTKPPVIHGINGVSQKSAAAGRASHYVSLTRLATGGVVTLQGTSYKVQGLSWMDHEFFSHSLESDQAGWDWFSLQMEDGSELMLYRLRRKDGTVDPYSSGAYVDPEGNQRTLRLQDFTLEPGRTWTSPATKASYPIEWNIRVPSLNITGAVRTRLAQQELVTKSSASPSYWEGAVEFQGSRGRAPLRGSGYLEMTGYAGDVRMGE
jgi:predicted secreted hydrolase